MPGNILSSAQSARARRLRRLERAAGVRLRRHAGADRPDARRPPGCAPRHARGSRASPTAIRASSSRAGRSTTSRRRLNRIPVWYLFGNHGFEPHAGTTTHAARVADWVHRLHARLPARAGHGDRGQEILRHDALPQRPRQTRRAWRRSTTPSGAAGRAGARAAPKAINLLPRGGADKGVALQQARRMFACDNAIYVGDDETDEDAFASAPPDGCWRSALARAAPRGRSTAAIRSATIDALLRRSDGRLRASADGAMQTMQRIDPLWYKDAVIYQLHVRTFCDGNGDGIGDFTGSDAEARLPAAPRRDVPVAAAVLRVAPARRRLRHRRTTSAIHPDYGTMRRLPGVPRRGARARAAGHHRTGHQPHLRSAPLVPGGAARAGGVAEARLLRLERHRPAVSRGARDLQRRRNVQLDLGSGCRRVLLAPVLLTTSRI